MFSKKIKITSFDLKKKNNKKIKRLFSEILQRKNPNYKIVDTFSKNYQYSFNKKKIAKFNKYKAISIFGLGGSSLCIKAIYDFLRSKIKKKVYVALIDCQKYNPRLLLLLNAGLRNRCVGNWTLAILTAWALGMRLTL